MNKGRPDYYENRNNLEKAVKELMMKEPLISLTSLCKKVHSCNATAGHIYQKIRSSDEWKTWIKDHENRVNLEIGQGIDTINRPSD